MYVMVDGLARLLAPILPVTADELWRVLPGTREDVGPPRRLPVRSGGWRDDALVERWQRLIEIRDGSTARSSRSGSRRSSARRSRRASTLTASNGVRTLLQRYAVGSADAVHRVAGHGQRRRARPMPTLVGQGRARRRHQVPALLALRPPTSRPSRRSTGLRAMRRMRWRRPAGTSVDDRAVDRGR